MHCTFTFWFTLCRRGQSGICLTTGRITMETGRAQDTLKNEHHNIQEPVNQHFGNYFIVYTSDAPTVIHVQDCQQWIVRGWG